MWKFEKYERKETPVPPRVIMSMRSGLETRYADRFSQYAGTSSDALRHADNARRTADSLRTAAGVVDAQKENIDELFIAAELMVKMIDDFQRESGAKQIKNIPLPGASIKESSGKKLGYVKLSMKFVSAGLLHFMEMTLAMMEDIKTKDNIIKAIADHRVEVPIIGRLMDIELDDLSSDDPIVETKVPLKDDDEEEMLAHMERKEPQLLPAAPVTPPKTPQPTPSAKKVNKAQPSLPPKPVSPTSTKTSKKA